MSNIPVTPVKTSRNGEVTRPTRAKAIGMLHAHQSCRKVAAMLGISKTTVNNIAQHPHSSRPGKQRQGRKKLLDERAMRHLIQLATKNWESRQFSWAQLQRASQVPVCVDTVRKAMNNAGYTRCKACRKPFISKANVKK